MKSESELSVVQIMCSYPSPSGQSHRAYNPVRYLCCNIYLQHGQSTTWLVDLIASELEEFDPSPLSTIFMAFCISRMASASSIFQLLVSCELTISCSISSRLPALVPFPEHDVAISWERNMPHVLYLSLFLLKFASRAASISKASQTLSRKGISDLTRSVRYRSLNFTL